MGLRLVRLWGFRAEACWEFLNGFIIGSVMRTPAFCQYSLSVLTVTQASLDPETPFEL